MTLADCLSGQRNTASAERCTRFRPWSIVITSALVPVFIFFIFILVMTSCCFRRRRRRRVVGLEKLTRGIELEDWILRHSRRIIER